MLKIILIIVAIIATVVVIIRRKKNDKDEPTIPNCGQPNLDPTVQNDPEVNC